MKEIKERRGVRHRGVIGWHHHHKGYGSVLFHDYAPIETAVEKDEDGQEYRLIWHTHDVSHDLEFNHVDDDERPCTDPNCGARKRWPDDQIVPL